MLLTMSQLRAEARAGDPSRVRREICLMMVWSSNIRREDFLRSSFVLRSFVRHPRTTPPEICVFLVSPEEKPGRHPLLIRLFELGQLVYMVPVGHNSYN